MSDSSSGKSSAKIATMRLDRLLSNLGYGTRREIQSLARYGAITLDGNPLYESDQRIALDPSLAARLEIDGEKIDPLPGLVLMMHKPPGVTCSHKEAGPLVYRLLPERWRRRDPALSTIGRLDKETSGLLLLTDDGAFLHDVISPRRHVPKRYRARLETPLRGDEAAIFQAGTLLLEGETKPLLPVEMQTISPREAIVTLSEGRYHQVRRMFAAVQNHVVDLHRLSVGGLCLPDDLAPGAFQILTAQQRAEIFSSNPQTQDKPSHPAPSEG